MNEQKVCLTIAGLDPSGGAGIIADVKTFSAFGCFAAAAISSITFQNTTGVFGTVHSDAASVRGQVEAVFDDLNVAAVKTGMLPTRETIEETARILSERLVPALVVDPVVRSTSGFDLIDDSALTILTEKLFPLSLIVTPNLREAERIAGIDIRSRNDIRSAGARMIAMGAANVLIKGGHAIEDDAVEGKARDYLFGSDGSTRVFEAAYIDTSATHGTGCTLAAAITANLALGRKLGDAIAIAKDFVTEAIRTSKGHGSGHSPVHIAPVSAR